MSNYSDQIIMLPIYKPNIEVLIKQDTKDGIGLIDHEISDTFPQWRFKGVSTTIYKDNQNYQETHIQGPHKNQLLQVTKLKSSYQITFHTDQQTYIVVKDIKSKNGPEYPLNINSIIRLGRVEYRVIEERDKNMQITQAPCFTKHIVIQPCNQTYECRFCFMEGKQSKEQLFLTNICRCQGNSRAVHLDCLRFWIDQNLTKEETHFGLTLKWYLLTQIIFQGLRLMNVQFVKINCLPELSMRMNILICSLLKDLKCSILFYKYQVQLSKNMNREKNSCTEMYLIHGLLNDDIKIGRAFTCDLKAQDITVSRHHATIRLNNDGNFIITDNKSKFGTLVSISEDKVNLDYLACSFQVGKLLLQIIQSDVVHKSSPSTQHKLTQLPQINKQLDEDEPQMDDDSFQIENK